MVPSISSSSFFFFLLILHLHPSHLSSAQPFPTQTITFTSFNDSTRGSFTFLKDSTYSQGALQLTPDTLNNASYLQNKSGRVVFQQPFKLWDYGSSINSTTNTTANVVASFNTIIHVNIYRDASMEVGGEGLAFVILPDHENEPPPGSEGGFLGLTNSTTDGKSSNQFVAIELDTFKQSYDPDDNHVGLNINSVISVSNASLNPAGIVISPINGSDHVVWIDYNGPTRQIKVYVANISAPKPATPILTSPLDLSQHVAQHSYFGFSGSTGEHYELNCVRYWQMMVEILPVENDGNVKEWILKAGLPILGGLLLILAVATVIYGRQRNSKVRNGIVVAMKSLPGMAREYDYRDLKAATGNFGDKFRLGKGGFGEVFWGKLPGEATEVAVKSFSRESSQIDFLAELTIINRLRHRNLVPLLGWCFRNERLLLVYEYMPNGSLDKYLFNPHDITLSWEKRYNIVAGVVSALHYLHDEFDQKVLHRDLKASNIMLDASFNARLGDFGLARAIDNERTSFVESGGMPGTIGYIAPECLHALKATKESDVFAFGAVVLEVVCGRRPGLPVDGIQSLAEWVWSKYREGRILEAVDPRLAGNFHAEEATRLLLLGLACSHPIATERPKTEAIVQIINKLVQVPSVPHLRPAFVWPGSSLPSMASEGTSTSTLSQGHSISSFNSEH